jgi:hypothetical protein
MVARSGPRPRAVPVDILADRLDRSATAIGLEPDELEALQRELLPEEFGTAAATPATETRPATAGRVSAMAARARLGVPLKCLADPGAVDGRPAEREYVLMVRLKAPTYDQALGEAREVLGRGKMVDRRSKRACGLPPRCSVEAV